MINFRWDDMILIIATIHGVSVLVIDMLRIDLIKIKMKVKTILSVLLNLGHLGPGKGTRCQNRGTGPGGPHKRAEKIINRELGTSTERISTDGRGAVGDV